MKQKIFLAIAASALLLGCGGGGNVRPQFADEEYPVMTAGISSATMSV